MFNFEGRYKHIKETPELPEFEWHDFISNYNNKFIITAPNTLEFNFRADSQQLLQKNYDNRITRGLLTFNDGEIVEFANWILENVE